MVHTPHLRKLAKDGVRLTNHHVQPFCSPTRATILTGLRVKPVRTASVAKTPYGTACVMASLSGRHVLRYGLQNTVIWPQDAWAVPQNETLLSQRLKAQGYYTASLGKVPPARP